MHKRVAAMIIGVGLVVGAAAASAQEVGVSGTITWTGLPFTVETAHVSGLDADTALAISGSAGTYAGTAPANSTLALEVSLERCLTPGCLSPGHDDPGDDLELPLPPVDLGSSDAQVNGGLPAGYGFGWVSGVVTVDRGTIASGTVNLFTAHSDANGNTDAYHFVTAPLDLIDATHASYLVQIGAGEVLNQSANVLLAECPASALQGFATTGYQVTDSSTMGDPIVSDPITLTDPALGTPGVIEGHVAYDGPLGATPAGTFVSVQRTDGLAFDPCDGAVSSAGALLPGYGGPYELDNLVPGTYSLVASQDWTIAHGEYRYDLDATVPLAPGATVTENLALRDPSQLYGFFDVSWLDLGKNDLGNIFVDGERDGPQASFYYGSLLPRETAILLHLLLDSHLASWTGQLTATVGYGYDGDASSELIVTGPPAAIGRPRAGLESFPRPLLRSFDGVGDVAHWTITGAPAGADGAFGGWSGSSSVGAVSATASVPSQLGFNSYTPGDIMRITLTPGSWTGDYNVQWFVSDPCCSQENHDYDLGVEVAAGDVVTQDFSGPRFSHITITRTSLLQIQLTATVADADGVASVTANGVKAAVDAHGQIRVKLLPSGTLTLVAKDALGNQTTLVRRLMLRVDHRP